MIALNLRRKNKDIFMKAIRFGLVSSTLFIACAAFANDAPPSDASIQELTTLAHSQEVFSGMKPQMDAMIASSMKEASQGQIITPERHAVLDRMRSPCSKTQSPDLVADRHHLRRCAVVPVGTLTAGGQITAAAIAKLSAAPFPEARLVGKMAEV
jgi:hypothetical protein